ncbi:MAG: hypothetical protein ACP5HQ_07455 [Thermoprotei archaeon]
MLALAIALLSLVTPYFNFTVSVSYQGLQPTVGVLHSGYIYISVPGNISSISSPLPYVRLNSTTIAINPALVTNGSTVNLKYTGGNANVTFYIRNIEGSRASATLPTLTTPDSSMIVHRTSESGNETSKNWAYLAIAIASAVIVIALELSRRRA